MSILIVAENRNARFEYHILETFEAGLILTGSEVKSLRNKQVQLKDSYVTFKSGAKSKGTHSGYEAFLQNAHISEYKASSHNNHHPERLRKLLMHRRELDRLWGAIREKGQTIIPLKIYFKKGKAKVELALAKGKKLHDKRETLKKRDVDQEMRRNLKRSR